VDWLVDGSAGSKCSGKSRDELLESLRIGAEHMLARDIPFIADA